MRIRFRNQFTTSCYGSYGKYEIRELIQSSESQISIVRKSYRKLKCNYSDEFERLTVIIGMTGIGFTIDQNIGLAIGLDQTFD